MRTDELIERLAGDTRPVRGNMVARTLLLTLAVAVGVALAFVVAWLGMRPDIHTAMRTPPFMMKALYTLALAAGGFWMCLRLARPDGETGRTWVVPALAAGVLAVLAGMELAHTPVETWRALMMGDSAMVCPWRILAISAPVYVLVIWALRRLAPTQLRLAGAAAGLLAGGIGATIYGLHCQETAASFTVSWYSLGIALCVAVGALTGPRLLAWRK